jgi:hypothetical protein
MPGISDPNMASEVWERVIGKADGVIWCTHATQAWRQSEASVWESLDPALFAKSLLLVTRFDKITSETDRVSVMKRVERETEGLFTDRLPISLTEALAAGDDPDLWDKSGAAAFMACLTTILDRLADETGIGQSADPAARRISGRRCAAGPVSSVSAGRAHGRPVTPSRILPRRIRPVSDAIHPNAEAETRDHAV